MNSCRVVDRQCLSQTRIDQLHRSGSRRLSGGQPRRRKGTVVINQASKSFNLGLHVYNFADGTARIRVMSTMMMADRIPIRSSRVRLNTPPIAS